MLPPEPIFAELGEDFEFHVIGQSLTVKQQVFAYIVRAKEYITPAQIFSESIGSNTSVYKALKALSDEGKIVKSQWGHYKKS